MKILLTLLMSISLAAAAMAQQDDNAQAKKKHHKGEQQQQANEQSSQPAPHQAQHQAQHGQNASQGQNQHQHQNAAEGQNQHQGQSAQQHNAQHNPHHTAPDAAPSATSDANGKTAAHNQHHQNAAKTEQTTDANSGSTTNAAATEDRTARQHNERNAQRTGNAGTSETATANDTTSGNNNARTSGNNNGTTQTTAATSTTGNEPGRRHGKGQKVDPQVVQQVKRQHVNFKAQPKPERVPAVTFNQNYRINGAQNWQGSQYEVFRSYHPQWHDQGWYRAHYPRVEIIAGGAYYFNNGFWYPAWGYNPSYQYYAYDAPIYVGRSAEPPDRVIADVQAVLQQEGYYKGEVDGLLGPLTREALTQYQSDNGLYATATIDEPTLSSLNLG